MSNVLYLSTDGLTDPLGQSQILPYLFGLREKGHVITIISLEKPARQAEVEPLRQMLQQRGINWFPLRYHRKPPIISTVADLVAVYRLSRRLLKTYPIGMVHCRSYLAALVGLRLKKKSNVKLLFDTRGFWIDERIEGKIWNPKNPVYVLIIRWLKTQEKRLFKNADAVVMLTETSKEYIKSKSALNPAASLVEVIPCCTDEKLFSPVQKNDPQRAAWAAQLGISETDFIVVYHGSLGTWYKTDELIDFFAVLNASYPAARLLVVTPDRTDTLIARWKAAGLAPAKMITCRAPRAQMPIVLSLAHLAVFFIAPTFSKMASSPTKLGEVCFMQIPFITNTGVGDIDLLITQTTSGKTITGFSQEAYQQVVRQITPSFLSAKPGEALLTCFSLAGGVEKYHSLYLALDDR